MISQETYVAALRWFGWKEAKARQIVNERASAGTLDHLDHLVRQYNLHKKIKAPATTRNSDQGRKVLRKCIPSNINSSIS